MANCIIGFPRWTDKITFSGSVGSWDAGYPASNMKVLPLSKVARSEDCDLANTQFAAILDKPRAVQLVGIFRHNLTLDAQLRIRLYAEAAMTTLLVDTGWVEVWPSVYPVEQLEWEDDNWWSGKYTTDEIAGYPWNFVKYFDQVYLPEAVKVEIDDQLNPDDAIDIGLCEIARAWQPSVNFGYGAQFGYDPRTRLTEADSGVEYAERRDKPRIFNGQLSYLPRDEALARGFELQRQADLDTPFAFIPNPEDTLHAVRTVILAKNASLGLQQYASYNRNSFPLALKEVL